MARAHVLHALPVFIAVLLAVTPAARANVHPPTVLLVHVQPMDPNYCNLPGIDSCDRVTQTTSDTGDLLFVIYLQSGWSWEGISSLDFTLRWDPGWELWGWEPCVDANLSYDYWYGNEITFHYDFPDCPPIPEFLPICALGITVNNHGCIEVLDDGTIHWGSPGGWYETPLGGKAEAGVDCAYSCFMTCGGGFHCVVQLTPEELHFELAPGQVGTQVLHLATDCEVRWVSLEATEPWVAFDVTEHGDHDADVQVTVDAWGLTPGEYTAQVLATLLGRDCSRITLTVIDAPESVPDDQSPPPSGSTPTTWGGVKSLFRVTPTR